MHCTPPTKLINSIQTVAMSTPIIIIISTVRGKLLILTVLSLRMIIIVI